MSNMLYLYLGRNQLTGEINIIEIYVRDMKCPCRAALLKENGIDLLHGER